MAPAGCRRAARFSLLHAPGLGDLLQCLAGHFRMRRRPGDDDADALIHLAQIESAGGGCIGIAVALHGLSGQRCLQCVKDLFAPAPVRNAGALEMGDHYRHLAVAAGGKSLAHGSEDLLGLGTHVRSVDRAGGGERFGKRHYFLRWSRAGRPVGEAGTQAQCTVIQSLGQLGAHSLDLSRGGSAVQPIHMVIAQSCVAGQCRHIDCRLCRVHCRHVGREGGIAESVCLPQQIHWIGRRARSTGPAPH